jgi:hypothetical protein
MMIVIIVPVGTSDDCDYLTSTYQVVQLDFFFLLFNFGYVNNFLIYFVN